MTKKALLHHNTLPDILLKLENKSFDAVGVEYGVSGMTVKRFLRRHGIDLKPYLATRGGKRTPAPAVLPEADEPLKEKRTYQGKNGAPVFEKPFRASRKGEWPTVCPLRSETEYPNEYPYNATHLPSGEYFSPVRGASSAYTTSLHAERGSWEL